ncbi:hypothetical protein BDZ89DRAFT_1068638 [Hymenopellis radicata]|nr:hypothetical protein BDZ89DRAFT_1068638 [Hymenopellis radicata]
MPEHVERTTHFDSGSPSHPSHTPLRAAAVPFSFPDTPKIISISPHHLDHSRSPSNSGEDLLRSSCVPSDTSFRPSSSHGPHWCLPERDFQPLILRPTTRSPTAPSLRLTLRKQKHANHTSFVDLPHSQNALLLLQVLRSSSPCQSPTTT